MTQQFEVNDIHVEVSCPVERTFRVDQVAGFMDLEVGETSSRKWDVKLPASDGDWQIGAIVGPSGSGKSVIARNAYGDNLMSQHSFNWASDKAIVEEISGDERMSIKKITGMLNSVGFSSPPDWIKPYRVLSNGQQFRCDLARALLTGNGLVAFDEFTSVVDRTVAKIGSAAVAKTVRRNAKSKFIAVTCHYDVLQWLEPDWVLDMQTGKLHLKSLGKVTAPAKRSGAALRSNSNCAWLALASAADCVRGVCLARITI